MDSGIGATPAAPRRDVLDGRPWPILDCLVSLMLGRRLLPWWARALLLSLAMDSGVLAQAGVLQGPPQGNPYDEEDDGTPRTPVLSPPRLLQPVAPEYPEKALSQGLTGRVELELVIDEQGQVAQATVVVPVGHGFDEAALAAARKLRFQPATRDGDPIRARVRYPFVFELRNGTPSPDALGDVPTPEDAPARFEGMLRSDDDVPLGGAIITISGDAVSDAAVRTGGDGRFSFQGLPPGRYTVRVTAPGHVERVEQEQLHPNEVTEVTYRMAEAPDEAAYGAVARIPPPPREVTRRRINRTQLTRIPGTRGDALRTVELQPGVARPPLGAGALIIRGSSPQDSQVQLEGLPVPLLYHFGGLTSFFHSLLLESVDFFPGNFGVRYGRRRGGIVEANVRDPARDGFHGVADINVLDASAILEGPITDDWEFAIAGRRSYIDFVFESILPEEDFAVLAAPVYYDYQLVTTYRPDDDNRLRLMLYGSSDEFALLFAEPADNSAAVDSLQLSTAFHRAHGSWYSKLSERTRQDVEVAVESLRLRFGAGERVNFRLTGTSIFGRSEWRTRVNDAVQLVGGLDLYVLPGKVAYQGPVVEQGEGNPGSMGGPLSNQDTIATESEFTVFQPAVYLEAQLSLYPARLVLGSRLDYYGTLGRFTHDPRATFIYTLAETTRLKAGIGLFSQPPQPQETDVVLGNPELKPTQTLHLSGGVDHDLDEAISVGIETFYKHLWDRVVSTQRGAPPFFTNGGLGRVYGLELLAKVEPRGRFFGYLSYTLSRSERRDLDGRWRLFDFDQSHILTAAAVYRLGSGWELGATFRLVTGNPNTPIVGGLLNVDTGDYSPLYGPVNSARAAAFHRLDVLVRKTWVWDAFRLALYLDVQNVYNRANPEGVLYDARYQQRATLQGLPIIPNLGVRGQF